MKRITAPLMVLACCALASLAFGCSGNERDGSTTQAACVAYAEAANACWQVATSEDAVEVSQCEGVDADIDTAQIPEGSSCALMNLAEIYTCYADAINRSQSRACGHVAQHW